jgi:hypothetical protein
MDQYGPGRAEESLWSSETKSYHLIYDQRLHYLMQKRISQGRRNVLDTFVIAVSQPSLRSPRPAKKGQMHPPVPVSTAEPPRLEETGRGKREKAETRHNK